MVPGEGAADAVEEEVQEVVRCAEVPKSVEKLLDVALKEGIAEGGMYNWASGLGQLGPSPPPCPAVSECPE